MRQGGFSAGCQIHALALRSDLQKFVTPVGEEKAVLEWAKRLHVNLLKLTLVFPSPTLAGIHAFIESRP